MTPKVDFSALSRRELQTLCKQHKIPANKTNVFMAESLDALLNNAPRQQEEFLEDEAPAPDSPEVEKLVAKVKGKRAPKKALLPEPEVDSLAGLLANSSLNSNVQEEMILAETEEPENISAERLVPSENLLPLAPLVPKGRRGRPRITKKEEPIVQALIPETVQPDENNIAADANDAVSEVAEIFEANSTSPERAVISAPEERQDEGTPIVHTRTKRLARMKVATKIVETEVRSMAMEEEVETEMVEIMEGQHSSSREEAEDIILGPVAPNLSLKLKKAGSHLTAESRIEVVDVEGFVDAPGSQIVDADIEPEMEETAPAPIEKKSKKTKKGCKSRRNAKVEVELTVEEPAEMKDEDLLSAESIEELEEIAVGGNNFSSISPPTVLEEEALVQLKQSSKSEREKSKTSRKMKSSLKPRKNVDQIPAPVVEDDVCENNEDEPAEVRDFVSTRHVRAAATEEMEAEEDPLEEPVTPIKKAGSNNVADDKENDNKEALLSLSMRKLVKKCKEKGLRTRGANNSRSVKL